ncbi:hypothetical protein RHGRI_029607 [Rhododendron griersonianum]|uniref:Uncharacterized protein n=1 Tax=Rhododendron griersonianum TaxID=479676 RepID=A0AAV6IK46_9ERIC|nr:hypothetical protein RHGRI_029607 [Rhododendron griersonianum]
MGLRTEPPSHISECTRGLRTDPPSHITEGSVPTSETYYRGLRTDPRAILPKAPYRPRRHTTEGSRASPLRLMRHSIEKNPREGLTWPCAPSNLIVGGSLGSQSPSDLLQVRRRKQRSSGGRNPTRTTVKVPINRTPTQRRDDGGKVRIEANSSDHALQRQGARAGDGVGVWIRDDAGIDGEGKGEGVAGIGEGERVGV